jgi:predicted Zn finger-like uncharacterized protein
MIVICTRCQARFKVADEKVGPRGAKVRCTRCQTVFVVHRDPGVIGADPAPSHAPEPSPAAAPPIRSGPFDVDLEARRPAGRAPSRVAPDGDPFAPAVTPAVAPPFAPDPFVRARPDPFAAATADPFAARSEPAGDPFAANHDPFAAAVTRTGPVDLGALLGVSAPAPAAAHLALEMAEPTPPATAAPAAPPAAPRAAATGEIDFSGDFDFAQEPAPDPAPFPARDPVPTGADLALEDRTTPGPTAGVRTGGGDALLGGDDALPAPDPFSSGAEIGFADPSEVSFYAGGDDGSLALATDPAPAAEPAHAAPPPPPRQASPPVPRRPDDAEPQPAAPPRADERRARRGDAPGAARIPGGGSRLRSVAVNAVALAALLVVALAFRVAWRGEGGLGAAALRPAAVLGALRPGDAAAVAPFAAERVTSGLYERAKAPPLVFVRGEVVSRASVAVPRVRVAVEIVRDGRVLARGAALAGAVPTPEELHGAGDDAELGRLGANIRARATVAVAPGARVPFLVAIGDAPADLAGAAVRVAAEGEAAR